MSIFSRAKNKKAAKEQMYHHEDVRILREGVAGAARRSPEPIKSYLIDKLKLFALKVEKYCKCPEVSFIEKEKAYACLFCGKRHKKMKLLK